MQNAKQVTVAQALVVTMISVGILIAVMFRDESEHLFAELNTLWEPVTQVVKQMLAMEQSLPKPDDTMKEVRKKKSKSSQEKPANEPSLGLEGGGGLGLLSEELAEDSLYEEEILRERPEGVRSGQAVLDALNEIEGWSPIENGYNANRLKLYLRYPKLWVRLSAFAFAMKAKLLSEREEMKLARLITLKNRDNPTQVRRFLTRYERKDPDLFEQLKKRLVVPEVSSPEVLEFDQGEEDAGNDAS